MPNNMQLTQCYEEKRELLTELLYTRGGSVQVTRRSYAYDALGRPYSRGTEYPQKEERYTASFSYNPRSELTNAQLDEAPYAYNYDNIGNRISAQEAVEQITYAANALNQYTQIDTNGSDFTPEYDANGNQTLVQTSTGIWRVTYNAENRAVKFESADGNTIIDCAYDYMGRRFEKKVTTNGTVTLRQRYLYRGYLQIAAIDLQRSAQPALWYITWDPTQPTATRPLAIQKDGNWFTYGWDLTKNICEIYGPSGFIRTAYTYTPYGSITAEGDVDQPVQWSSEYHDTELALIYYNFRCYNPASGGWTRRDPIGIKGGFNLYMYAQNAPIQRFDVRGEYTQLLCCLAYAGLSIWNMYDRLSSDTCAGKEGLDWLMCIGVNVVESFLPAGILDSVLFKYACCVLQNQSKGFGQAATDCLEDIVSELLLELAHESALLCCAGGAGAAATQLRSILRLMRIPQLRGACACRGI